MVLAVLFCVEVRIRTHLNAVRAQHRRRGLDRVAPLLSLAAARDNANRIRPPQLYIDHNRRGFSAEKRIRPLALAKTPDFCYHKKEVMPCV